MKPTAKAPMSIPPKHIRLYSPYSLQECHALLKRYVSTANTISFLSSNKLAGHIENDSIRLWINAPRTWSSLSGDMQSYQNGTLIEGVFNDVGDTGRPAKHLFFYSIGISLFFLGLDYVIRLFVQDATLSLLPVSGAVLFFGVLIAFIVASVGSGIHDRHTILVFLDEILLTQIIETAQND